MIDQATIEKIIDSAEITEVVEEYVKLKKSGANFMGLCPFHNEKTPSFVVSPAKGIFKCFGCGKGGNSVNFIMEHEHLSYYDALKQLARKYHIEVAERPLSQEEIHQNTERESLLVVTAYAQKYFSEILHTHPDGMAIGLSYFRERGFKDHIIEKFQLGYCPDKKDDFTQAAIKKGYKLEYLVKTGLTVQKEDWTADRFSGRVIFPVHNLSGSVIAFGGRTLKNDKTIAKYLNSPESDLYHKSKTLYGVFYAKNTIVKNDKCFLVEGYTDVISMHQAGIENVVASSGTSLTTEQIRLIKRFTKNVTILYDGDPAGIKASLRGIDMVLEEGLNVRVLLFPDGEDPDSFSKKISSSELIEYINKHERDFISFKTRLLLKDAQNDPAKMAGLINDIVASIAVIPDSITRSVYIKECSGMMKVEENVLYFEINKLRRNKSEQRYRHDPLPEVVKPKVSALQPIHTGQSTEPQEREIIRLLLNYGNRPLFRNKNTDAEDEEIVTVSEFIIRELKIDELEPENPIYKQIFEEVQDILNKGLRIDEKYFINHYDEAISGLAADLFTTGYNLSKIWEKHENYVETEEMILKKLVPECVMAYKNVKINIALKETEILIKNATEIEEINELIQRHITLKEANKILSKSLGDRTIL